MSVLNTAWLLNENNRLQIELAEVEKERDHLKELIEADAPCRPECDSYAHEDDCPYADLGNRLYWYMTQLRELKKELDKLKGQEELFAFAKDSIAEWVYLDGGDYEESGSQCPTCGGWKEEPKTSQAKRERHVGHESDCLYVKFFRRV